MKYVISYIAGGACAALIISMSLGGLSCAKVAPLSYWLNWIFGG
jgi:hypothetical protein